MGKRRRVIDVDVYEEDTDTSLHSSNFSEDKGSERDRSSRSEESSYRRKSRRNDDETENNDSSNFDFGNIDFNQIASLLQNVDLNQLGSLLGAFGNSNQNGQGILEGLGALAGSESGQGLLGNLGSLLGSGGLQGLLGSLGGLTGILNNSTSAPSENSDYKDVPIKGDRGVEILWALRPLVTPERAELIEMVVQLYAIGKILKGTFY
ncbi:MAG: hypothetical protein GX206_04305 [Clostridiales bacterium]|nr:hypothetical protein [Clostridiales bacterium]